MALPNDSHTAAQGATGTPVATHLIGGKEYQVLMLADEDGHIKETRHYYVAGLNNGGPPTQGSNSTTYTAGTHQTLGGLWHLANSTKTVRIERIEFAFAATAATIFGLGLQRIDPAGTMPTAGFIESWRLDRYSGQPFAEAVASRTNNIPLRDDQIFFQEFNLAANAATARPQAEQPITLWPAAHGPHRPLILPPGQQDGWAIVGRSSAAVTIRWTARILYTEH